MIQDQIPAMKTVQACVLAVMMAYTFSLDWRDSSNLRRKKPFSELTTHERDMLVEAIDDKIHKCDRMVFQIYML